MGEITLRKICKWFIIAFIFYVCWVKYAFGERSYLLYITGLLPIGIMGFELLVTKEKLEGYFPFGVVVNLIMCVYSIITGIWVAKDPSLLVDQIKTYACVSLLCLAICYVTKEEKDLSWIAKTFIFVSIVCCVNVSVSGYYVADYGYVISIDNNPNTLGLVLDLGLFGLAYIDREAKGYRRIIDVLCAAFFLYFIVGCGSRKCLLGGVIICLLWLIPVIKEIFSSSGYVKKTIFVLAALALIAFIVQYYNETYVNTESFHRMEMLGDTSNARGSSALRLSYYKRAIELLSEHPVFGIGFQQFRFWNERHAYSHSTYAEAIASWGIAGSLLYFIPVLVTGWRLVNIILYHKNSYAARIIFALLIMELFIGAGQIWFYEIEHLIALTLIFLYTNMEYQEDSDTKKASIERRCKYVKA